MRYTLDIVPLQITDTGYRPDDDGGYEIAEVRHYTAYREYDFFIEFETGAMEANVAGKRVDFSTSGRSGANLPWVTDITSNCCWIRGFMTFDAAYRVVDWDIDYSDDHPHMRYTPTAVSQFDLFDGWKDENDGFRIVEGTLAGPFNWTMSGTLPGAGAESDLSRIPLTAAVPLGGSLPFLFGALGAFALCGRRSLRSGTLRVRPA